MVIRTGDILDTRIIRIEPGNDILHGLEEAVKDEGIRNAVILAGIGSAASYRFHVVSSTDLPPTESFPDGRGAYDITSVTGYVMNGRIHAHITFSDDKKAFGGHLEPGCQTLTFVIITLGIINPELSIDHLDSLKT